VLVAAARGGDVPVRRGGLGVQDVKCDPEESLALQAEYPQITPGYHLNKRHWITIVLDGGVPDDLVEQLVAASHALVRPRTPRPRR
jgi:predicted DNA-binding protein (MmcQ/YjbR family)